MNKEAKIIIDDICAHSVTFPSIPTTLISRKSYFVFITIEQPKLIRNIRV